MSPSLFRNPNPGPTLSDIYLVRVLMMAGVAGVAAVVLAWGVLFARVYTGCEKVFGC
jgi:hypothetical protein